MIPRFVSRRVRPMWIAALASAAWANRDDLARWAGFVRRAVNQRQSRPISDVVTEAKVRAAVSANPLLRRDPALKDLAVNDGVVTLLTTSAAWPDHRNGMRRILGVKGISEVISCSTTSVPVAQVVLSS